MPKPLNFRKAFTLVELFAVIGVVCLLLALSLPLLAASRQRALELKCRLNVAQLGSLVVMYSVDFKNYYPTWVTDGASTATHPERWKAYAMQGARLFNTERWLSYSDCGSDQPLYRCPANREFRVLGAKAQFDYYGGGSMYADPAFLDPDQSPSTWKNRFIGRAQTIDSVRFPSSKIGLFELFVWHGWRGAYSATGSWSTDSLSMFTSDRPFSAWYFDGSVGSLAFSQALGGVDRAPDWYSEAVWLTAFGSRGRDK
ncbi:MAG: hypothetical protein JNK16_08200 [Phycisphaerales bacterium]|nr:hypothetical protein [Phycisphaerales bacterium]